MSLKERKFGKVDYVPARGDIVWLKFSPQLGHEQAGYRPALCISPLKYNKIVGLAIFFPITSKTKGYPFEVKLPQNLDIEGVVLSDQIKNLDWQKREARFICKLPSVYLNKVIAKINTLILGS